MGFFDETSGGLITQWKTASAITDLVGTGNAAKIWPQVARQGAVPPYVTFTRADGRPIIDLGGPVGARLTVLHVYCWGITATQADTLADAVKDATEDLRGTYSGTIVHRVEAESIDDGYEQREPAAGYLNFWVRLVVRLVHSE